MGCICSKDYVVKQPNISGQELLGTRLQTKCMMMITSNKFHKVYNEQPLSYGPESVEIVFLRALGVAEYQEKQISVRFEEKTKSEQEGILMYLYMNWHHLQQDSSVSKALKETRFVTSADKRSQYLYKPKDLFDPGDPLLASVFSGEVQKFPGKRFASDRWLNILRKTGLQNTNVADTMLECALRVEFLGAKSMKHVRITVDDNNKDLLNTTNGVSLKIWSLAETLIKAIFEKNSLLYDQNFCNIFGKIVCIPAEKGFPFESGKKGVKRVLCSYSEAILLKDWQLAWSAASIVTRESLVPPEYSWGALQLRSPPPFTVVLKHLLQLQMQAELHTDSSILTTEEAISKVLHYLDRIWGTLSSSDVSKLKKIAFMPVGNTVFLACPFRIFSRPTIDLSPLAFELPSRYTPFLKILKELELQDTLSISSAMFFLSSLKRDFGYQRISPNELRAVMKILHFLCNEIIEQQESDGSDWESLLVVPDDSCRLVHPSSCVYVDPYGSRYMNYISSSKLRFAHHDIPGRLCLAFGIRKLSDVVVEELDCVEQVQTLEEIGSVSLAAIRHKLLSLPFQVAVSRVLHAVLGTSENPIFQTLQKSLESVAQRLQFVRCISARFWLPPQSLYITHVSMIPVLECGSNHQALYYVDASKICMLIAEPPSHVSVLDLVALVVSHVLGSPVPLSIGSLFLDDSETDLADILKLSSYKRVMDSVDYNIGFLGREIAPEDAKKAYFNHIKPFYKGEIVAWRSKIGYRLKYGRITEDIRQPRGKSNYRIKLETYPGKTETILFSLVYSFSDFPDGKEYATHVVHNDGDNVAKCVHLEQPDPSGKLKLRNQDTMEYKKRVRQQTR